MIKSPYPREVAPLAAAGPTRAQVLHDLGFFAFGALFTFWTLTLTLGQFWTVYTNSLFWISLVAVTLAGFACQWRGIGRVTYAIALQFLGMWLAYLVMAPQFTVKSSESPRYYDSYVATSILMVVSSAAVIVLGAVAWGIFGRDARARSWYEATRQSLAISLVMVMPVSLVSFVVFSVRGVDPSSVSFLGASIAFISLLFLGAMRYFQITRSATAESFRAFPIAPSMGLAALNAHCVMGTMPSLPAMYLFSLAVLLAGFVMSRVGTFRQESTDFDE